MNRQHPLIAKVATSGPFTTSRPAQLQTQSAFFTILNEDIRNQIYEYLFGCTCQRAYMEGTRVLYSTNVFNFGEEISLDIWGNSIKVQRWDLIRKVDLRIRLAVDLWLWERAWQVLQVMPCLRSAKLRCEEGIEEVYDLFHSTTRLPKTIKYGSPATENISSTNKEAGTSSIMVRFETGDEQSDSKFFTKLYPDIRREIFLHLFGSRHVHVMFANSRGVDKSEEFWRHGHPPLTHVGWLHCVCRSEAKLLPHAHFEYKHKWRYLSTNLLWTCKRAYEEGIALLYSSNTFLFQESIDLINFHTIAVDHMRFVRSLEIQINLGEQDTWRMEADAFRLMVSTLRGWQHWYALKPIKIRVVGELDDTPPRRPKQKVLREAQREFGRAVRELAEMVQVHVVLSGKGDKEIIQPRLSLDKPGLTFVNASEDCMDREDHEMDSDFEDSFHRVIQRA
ncbi:hypothetical protein CEP54_013335 [Fusarium duplospermum]|uniref:DUF7730 domain-containing protein n=1 Tax=Fusarium duplospermum TaxID=1325734 RepID=A0A428P3I7_9HYPO|nr:hypothetical protein CEP54_013335 [Fusarium duplospermum]